MLKDLTPSDEDEPTIVTERPYGSNPPSAPPPAALLTSKVAPSVRPPAAGRPSSAPPPWSAFPAATRGSTAPPPTALASTVAASTAPASAPSASTSVSTEIPNPLSPNPRSSGSDPLLALKDRWRDSKAGIALSRTLQPLAAGLRSPTVVASVVYVVSMVVLSLSGIAWYLSRTIPSESPGPAAAFAPSPNSEATTESAASASAETTPSPADSASKTPIDVLRLPVASSAAAQAGGRNKPAAKPAPQR